MPEELLVIQVVLAVGNRKSRTSFTLGGIYSLSGNRTANKQLPVCP